ncbi:MAG TPA: response regulator transcription factor [Chitinophagaceae bacterium]|nr:response regulator transcription factor [Chitinophagaceae bacterium]
MIKVAIVDDKTSNRRILEEKLLGNKMFSVTFKGANGEEFLENMRDLKDGELPDIAIMDLEMPVLDGVATIATASALYPAIKFVVLTVFDDDDKIFKAIKSGACGYLLKEESSSTITDMLLNLWENGAGPISPSIAYKILQMIQNNSAEKKIKDHLPNEDFFLLSEREKEILQLICKGLDYKEIASQIFVSPNTVKKHIFNIYNKLHVSSKAQAMRIAYLRGLI